MGAKTFTTEFSIAGARSASAARAVDPSAVATLKLHSKPKPTIPSRLKDVMFVIGVLLSTDRKGEQGVARIDIDRAVHDGHSAMIQGTAARLDAVLGLKVLGRVV